MVGIVLPKIPVPSTYLTHGFCGKLIKIIPDSEEEQNDHFDAVGSQQILKASEKRQ